MGIGLLLALVFGVAFGTIYGLMRLSCLLKKEYLRAESWTYKLLTFFMCESCKEACESHTKLVFRALLFSAVIAAVVGLTKYFAG